MKKVLMSVAVAGIVTSVSAADLGSKDAEFLFGQSDINAVAMSSMEMAQTEGQLLEVLTPVLGIVGAVPIVGPLVGGLLGGLTGDLLGAVDGLLGGLPLVGDLVGTVVGLLDLNTLVGLVPAVLGAAQPIQVSVHAGELLQVDLQGTVNTALPAMVGGLI